jgi:5'-AMP-activated protein kinase catalytic alpha subunit
MDQYGFDLQYAKRCLDQNRHNHTTTTYYLILKKHLENGGTSVADVTSDSFDPSLFQTSLN